MPANTKKLPPALKHGAFAATTILPGKSETEIQKIARKHNRRAQSGRCSRTRNRLFPGSPHLAKRALGDFLESEHAQARFTNIQMSLQDTGVTDLFEESRPAADKRARQELGEAYDLVEIGEGVTLDGLARQLAILERLDRSIEADYKRLLLLRGVKSLSVAPKPLARERFPAPDRDKTADRS
jgi:hypothetical protein